MDKTVALASLGFCLVDSWIRLLSKWVAQSRGRQSCSCPSGFSLSLGDNAHQMMMVKNKSEQRTI